MEFEKILGLSFFGNTVLDYLIAFGAFIFTWLVIFIIKKAVFVWVKEIAKKTKTTLDVKIIEYLNSISIIFYVILSIYVSIIFLKVPEIIRDVVYYLFILTIAYYLIKFIHKVIEYFFSKLEKEQQHRYHEMDFSQLHLMRDILKIAVWIIALLLFLANLGFDVTALIAGLGIGGIAVAFALQNILADIFASFSIYFDKPFKRGDYIVVGNESGTIKKIGLKTTRIESLQGEEVVIPNKTLVESIVHNYKKMNYRRVTFNFGVTYETPLKKLEKIPQIIREVVDSQTYNNQQIAKVERVFFKKFGDFSLEYEVRYILYSNDYNVYVEIQNKINIEILRRFKKEGIEMAYPTRTVYLKK